MIKPKRSSVFLGRPFSAAGWTGGTGGEPGSIRFFIARRGGGTEELLNMHTGEEAELSGPLGNTWKEFLPGPAGQAGKNAGGSADSGGEKKIALIGGGIGVAPLLALGTELPPDSFDFYGGFRSASFCLEDVAARSVIIASEDGSEGEKGRIPDFLDPAKYAAVCACGPEAMLKAVAARSAAGGVPCFVSMERRMACGVGACLGCTVKTKNGNRRCCADGPVFPAGEIVFDD
ncbi:MAG: dihydroorotate dehydrogenase electron transfer subunit [Treponema sp.]|nr:dihydroorotate dehydrogenase electron transfer subunit [Treponema sp.]